MDAIGLTREEFRKQKDRQRVSEVGLVAGLQVERITPLTQSKPIYVPPSCTTLRGVQEVFCRKRFFRLRNG